MKEIFSNVQALDMERNRHNVFDAYDSDNIPFELVFDDECPICKYGIDMGKNAWHKFHDISEERQKTCNVICVHYCTHCHKAFVTEHKMYISKDCYKELSHNVYPIVLSEKVFSEEIKSVSNDFTNIYNQALFAKVHGLNEIYGMALRKAFECLVKDFALFNNPNKEEEIAKKNLACCITDYIKSAKINALCTSCRLIGNNETHWRNDNTADDVTLMEKVLMAVVHFIEQEIVVLEAQDYNNKHKK